VKPSPSEQLEMLSSLEKSPPQKHTKLQCNTEQKLPESQPSLEKDSSRKMVHFDYGDAESSGEEENSFMQEENKF
jgi:hypothetical protein